MHVGEAGRTRPFVVRRLRDRPAALPARIAALAGQVFGGELRLVAPDGRTVWSDVVRLLRWDGRGDPEACAVGLWQEQERREALCGAFVGQIERAVREGQRFGVLLAHDAAAIVALAEHGARMSATPVALRT